MSRYSAIGRALDYDAAESLLASGVSLADVLAFAVGQLDIIDTTGAPVSRTITTKPVPPSETGPTLIAPVWMVK